MNEDGLTSVRRRALLFLEDTERVADVDDIAQAVVDLVGEVRSYQRGERQPEWMAWMEAAAEASMGVDSFAFIIGVRGHNGTWFANFRGIEEDGHPRFSVPGVIEQIRRKAEETARGFQRDLDGAQRLVDSLPVVHRPEVEE